ncbi:hypothetical protein PAHAL_4G309600 [Panicum hallii]|uniref:Uncharacterized protein n=1 Tax=Panicum hallii TaxID=206008 RepID=A0A2T8JEJ5_9POAL|nr:hypothetical protein PAHAL_4G309600 [Panicum hallii]
MYIKLSIIETSFLGWIFAISSDQNVGRERFAAPNLRSAALVVLRRTGYKMDLRLRRSGGNWMEGEAMS